MKPLIWLNYKVNKRNHPKIAEHFRLVKYSNLPRLNTQVMSTFKLISS